MLIIQTGARGRPKKVIDPDILQNALHGDRRISILALANVLGVHRNTLPKKMKELGISADFDDLNDKDLDSYIRKYWQEHPDAGRAYTSSHLRSKHGVRVPRNRIISSIKRVDHLGQGIRQHVGAKKKSTEYILCRVQMHYGILTDTTSSYYGALLFTV